MASLIGTSALGLVDGPMPARLSVSQYHKMIDAGIFDEGPDVELLEGILVEKMSKKPPHSFYNGLLAELFRDLLPKDYCVRVQEPVTLQSSEPEPDIAVARGSHARYKNHHPTAQDIALVIEVAESSLYHDLKVKAPLYAKADVLECWVLDTNASRLIVFSGPAPGGYLHQRTYSPTESFQFALAETHLLIDVADIFKQP